MYHTRKTPTDTVSIALHLARNLNTFKNLTSPCLINDAQIDYENLTNRKKIALAFIKANCSLRLNLLLGVNVGANTDALKNLHIQIAPRIGKRLSDQQTSVILETIQNITN